MDYFVAGPDRTLRPKTTIKVQNELSNRFTDIGCFKGIFSCKVKDDAKPYQAPPQCEAYALQEPFNKELGRPQEQ